MLSYRLAHTFMLNFGTKVKHLAQQTTMAWKTYRYLWQWPLKSSPQQLWPYVADTQRFNQALGLPVIAFSEIPLEDGGSQLQGRTRLGLTVAYEEQPFQWVKNQEFSSLRVFQLGPLAQTFARLTLEPLGNGSLLKYYVEITPANLLGFLGSPYQFGWEMRRQADRAFHIIDDYLQNQASQPFDLPVTPLNSAAQARLRELTSQLAAQDYEPRWVQHLADLIISEADLNLARLRPYALADVWGAPRRLILELCLSAAKLGLLNMRWDILCPLCRGAKVIAPSLDKVERGVHCSTCNIDFEADFAQNVELTFIPHPQIRLVAYNTYCLGGPMITPHIVLHQTLQPGETRPLQAGLEPGRYRLRTQRPGVENWLNLADTPAGKLCLEVGRESIQANFEAATQTDKLPYTLTLTNHTERPQRVFIERAEWYTDAVTAAQVTTLQHFRDLFSDEVLRPGEEIGVQGMTILFSDLVGSTAMYNRWGDAPSYALVREQFAFLQRLVREYDGAIVKTIGDAIMAAFADPAKGVGAALAIQQEIQQFNTAHPHEPLIIKLGLHHGPCLAVNLNDRLDYFGATVNLAARLQGQSVGGDVVISQKLRQDPAVAQLLSASSLKVEPFETSIKGFDEHFSLYRLTLPAQQVHA